jgi:transcriptional/translational regulatory protein YebC/TACO1
MFSKKGLITVDAKAIGEDDLLEIALSAGAEDLQNTGQLYEITCQPSAFESLKKALEAQKIPLSSAEIAMVPQSNVKVADEETARKILNLMEDFEDHDDVQNVYANFDIPDTILARIGA